MPQAAILIAGAGPTGLVLAISLARRGAAFRIIDQAKGPGEQSRAMAVHARTLEFYAQFGFADEVIGEGIASDVIHLRERDRAGHSREALRVSFDQLGKGLSPYPFILTYPQDLHERLLVRQLSALGVTVERETALKAFRQDDKQAVATIEGPNGTETAAFDYLCGCDGAHSQVRAGTGVGFSGAAYEQPFYVADVRLEGRMDNDLYMNLGERLLALMLPVRMSGMHRLIGLVPPELAAKEDLGFEDLRREVEELVGVRVVEVNWFSRYRVHHRVADKFRVGRAFLLGDAGHIHSPVGGQGMNTGIGDAINLGWKLAHVATGRAGPALLDSYESERIAFARALVATTDRIFTPMIAAGLKGEAVRRIVAPLVGMVASSVSVARREAFKTVSQIRIEYEDSPLSEGKAGHVAGGDRLPWTGAGGENNFAPLRSLDWQIHVYGEAPPALRAFGERHALPVHVFGWGDGAHAAGLKRDAAYLVRPDGYVALAAPDDAARRIEAYFARVPVPQGRKPL